MTNKRVWLGMLAMVLAFGMTVVGCASSPAETVTDSNPNDITKFEGKWVNEGAVEYAGYRDFSWTFNGNTALFTSIASDGQRTSRSGTFTFTDTTITFTPQRRLAWSGYTQKYTLENNVLTLENYNNNPFGSFTKQ